MKRKQVAMWSGAAVVALYIAYLLAGSGGPRAQKPSPFGPFDAGAVSSASLTVQVSGRVIRPGVYVLPANARVQDALQKAGGAAPDADLEALNLAEWLQDGARIDVPPRRAGAGAALGTAPAATPDPLGEPTATTPLPDSVPFPTPSEIVISNAENFPTPTPVSVAPTLFPPLTGRTAPMAGASSPGGTAPGGDAVLEFLRRNPVDLNAAGAAQLELLPEIGPKLAARILEYRATHGAFGAVGELRRVKGVGDKTMAAVEPFVCVR